MQCHVKKVNVETAIATDHSPVLMNLCKKPPLKEKCPGFWKFNSSLLCDETYVSKMSETIDTLKEEQSNSRDKQVNWELLKYEIRKFSMSYSKKKGQGTEIYTGHA